MLALATAHCDGDDVADGSGSACAEPDQDGVIGGDFDVTVSDTTFAPLILKGQNAGKVTVRLTNSGTKPHGFAVQCLTTIVFEAEAGGLETQKASTRRGFVGSIVAKPSTRPGQQPASNAIHTTAAPPRSVLGTLSLYF